jgi:N-acetylglucosamine-6-phosphate deacetylase
MILHNCFIPRNGALVHSSVEIGTEGRIIKVTKLSNEKYGLSTLGRMKVDDRAPFAGNNDTILDCGGNILSPGFIDIQINGAFGVDFSSEKTTKEDVFRVARGLSKHGVTHFCPTLISCSKDTYKKMIPMLGSICHQDGKLMVSERRAKILGLHLEGPFFCAAKRGAHHLENIVEEMSNAIVSETYGFNSTELKKLGVCIVTLAPELDGASNAIQDFIKTGITVAMGHTNASLEQGIIAKAKGATLITHLFNAMKAFHHREPGLLGLLQTNESKQENDLFYSIIADGLHSHPTSVKMAYAMSKNAILITDAMSALDLGDGQHTLGDSTIHVKGNSATVAGTDTLAGSIVSMDSCIRSFVKFTSCSIVEALNAATYNPARVLGIERSIGSIEEGFIADLVLLDEKLNVMKTFSSGHVIYSSD